ncbi:hypothetical protein Vafri_455 [Volvox africanus]|nr:hypothetical protein Vafri_455 [Volvox africanus]
MKNERYLSRRDVLKALAASKFRPHMEGWNLRIDLRTSSQDILESQMQDLEDDNDPWDDDELQHGGDDDTMEGLILEKTENLTSMLKNAVRSQQDAMARLMVRLQQLTAEVAALRASGAAAAAAGAADDGVSDDDDIDGGGHRGDVVRRRPPPAPTRPPPAPTRPLPAPEMRLRLRSEEPSGADSDQFRQVPELPKPLPGSTEKHSLKDTKPNPETAGSGDNAGCRFAAATTTDDDGGTGAGSASTAAAAAAAATVEGSSSLSPSDVAKAPRVRPKTAPPRGAELTALPENVVSGESMTPVTLSPPPPPPFDEDKMKASIHQHHTAARPTHGTPTSLPP